MNKFTNEIARKRLNENKDNTMWFTDGITFNDLYDILRYQMRFGEAETQCIISSLKLNGAKILEENHPVCEIHRVHTEYQSIEIPGYTNTWSAFEKAETQGKTYYIMENDEWGDETCYLICTFENGIATVIGETFDDIETALEDEDII